jgi:ADP-heptose:LPS heptosyltransferase
VEILLLHPGGLGDILLSLPAIAILREEFPAARFTIAGNIDHVAPAVGAFVENAVSLSTLPLHNLYSEEPLPQADVRLWKSFDQIISWTGSGDPGFVRKLKAIHPNARIASWRPAPQESRHVSQLFIDSLGPKIASGRSIIPASISPGRELSRQGLQWLLDHKWNGGEPLATLHPGAGSRTKRWPLERFVRLARHLAFEENRKLLVIEGPAESGLATQIAEELPEADLIIAASLPLDALAAVIAKSGLFVGNDSGITHLAAALGIPSIALFGPTLPRHWAPLGPNVTMLWNPQSCNACSSGGNNHICMENITVEDVIRAIRGK